MATSALRLGGRLGGGLATAAEDLAEALDVVALDQRLALGPVLSKPVDELRTEDVDLPVQDPPPVRDILLLGCQAVDQLLELLIVHRADIGKGFLLHGIS